MNRPGSVQTNPVLKCRYRPAQPDYFAMNVMNQVLGAGPSARLYNNLREDVSYIYGAYSSFGGHAARSVAGDFKCGPT